MIRIAAPEGAYDYQNKYFTDVVQYHCPSGLGDALEREIQRITLEAYRTLGCRGWGRADLMVRASDRRPFLLEMNTSPGMTSHSLVPMSARAAGISYEQLCLQLVAGGRARQHARLSQIDMATIIRTPRATRREAVPLPSDVVLMNATANALFVLAVLGVLAVLVWWLAQLPVFRLVAIRVEGDIGRNSEATIRANAAPKLAGTFFTIDLGIGAARLRDRALGAPCGGAARVAEPTVGAARGAPAGGAVAASRRFRPGRRPARQQLRRGVRCQPRRRRGRRAADAERTRRAARRQMLAVLRDLDPLYRQLDWRIERLTLSGRGSWRAELDSGARIEIGRGTPEQLAQRSQRFVGTVAQVANQYLRPVQYADLRHHEGYALRLKGVSTTLTAAEKALRK